MDGAMDRMIEQNIAHHVHPQSNLRQHARDGPTMITRGKGVFINGTGGREIIDGLSGLGRISPSYHNEPLANAAVRPMNAPPFAPTSRNRTHSNSTELGEHLVGMASGGMNKAMSCCSGSEANDTAIKLLWYASTSKGEPNRRKNVGRARRRRANCRRTSPVKAGFACARSATG